jgi:hypothetical protein
MEIKRHSILEKSGSKHSFCGLPMNTIPSNKFEDRVFEIVSGRPTYVCGPFSKPRQNIGTEHRERFRYAKDIPLKQKEAISILTGNGCLK